MKKIHYFDQEKADADDILLEMAIQQGYVPPTCLLGGITVMAATREDLDACLGCNGPREKCKGRPKRK